MWRQPSVRCPIVSSHNQIRECGGNCLGKMGLGQTFPFSRPRQRIFRWWAHTEIVEQTALTIEEPPKENVMDDDKE